MSAVNKIAEADFDRVVSDKASNAVLVDFYADWCGPCKILSPVLEAVALEKPELKVVKVDVDASPALSKRLQIASIPSVHLYVGGKLVGSFVGYRPKEAVLDFVGMYV